MKNILRGDEIMVYDTQGRSIGWGTSHTLNITTEQTDISSKDYNGTRGVIVNQLAWEITASHLYSSEEFESLFETMNKRKPVYLYFGERTKLAAGDELKNVANDSFSAWSIDPSANIAHGNTENVAQFSETLATPQTATHAYYGKAYITSLSVSANTGESASFECTFTGDGPLTKCNTPS